MVCADTCRSGVRKFGVRKEWDRQHLTQEKNRKKTDVYKEKTETNTIKVSKFKKHNVSVRYKGLKKKVLGSAHIK